MFAKLTAVSSTHPPHPPIPGPQVQDAVRCRMGGCKDDSENSPDSCKNGQVQIMVNSIPFHRAIKLELTSVSSSHTARPLDRSARMSLRCMSRLCTIHFIPLIDIGNILKNILLKSTNPIYRTRQKTTYRNRLIWLVLMPPFYVWGFFCCFFPHYIQLAAWSQEFWLRYAEGLFEF